MPAKAKVKPYKELEEDVLTLVEEPYQLKLGENPDDIDVALLDEPKNIWDKSVKVEENGYYWKKDPFITKGNYQPTASRWLLNSFWLWWNFIRF
ncbi:MAG: hypothetical protein IPJ00_15410 [Saprospirales bacterium]|nr:hypothetical protein [Saprospirales bacterium]